ncbi:MAG TPA: DUF2161 family putative PD-(D/E)XK-type phosphodiesterase [Clostridia bacterium]|nr:DUF2161 family putative PD-(D/E)XK-type phosphodiesterase [Clostridia bacterium]
MKKDSFAETDLYDPIYEYLTQQGYTVRGEVKDCDIAAIKGDELIIVELKKNFTVDLLVQATQRQRLTSGVYVAVPRPKISLRSSKWKGIRRLLRRLELGLIFVSLMDSSPKVQVVFDPAPFTRREMKKAKQGVIKEIEGRFQDSNKGGSNRKKIMTAYRENAIFVACCLENGEILSSVELKEKGTGSRTYSILYDNYYGWFNRVSRGKYALTPKGKSALEGFPEEVEYYREVLTTPS